MSFGRLLDGKYGLIIEEIAGEGEMVLSACQLFDVSSLVNNRQVRGAVSYAAREIQYTNSSGILRVVRSSIIAAICADYMSACMYTTPSSSSVATFLKRKFEKCH